MFHTQRKTVMRVTIIKNISHIKSAVSFSMVMKIRDAYVTKCVTSNKGKLLYLDTKIAHLILYNVPSSPSEL